MIDKKKYKAPYSIQVTTISPVAVGSGELLSPYTDFVFDEPISKIHVLDKPSLTKGILAHSSGKELMEQYINGIYDSFDNNRANFNLRKFIEGEHGLNASAEEFAERSVAYYGLQARDRREIKCIVKDNHQPFIPGSSIKGAIKAAILYNWFLKAEEKEGDTNSPFSALMEQVLAVYSKCQREIESIQRFATKRFVSREDKFQIRNLKKQISRKGGRELGRDFDKVFAGLLTTSNKYLPKEFFHLKPSDSGLLEKEDLIFQLVKRLHYVKGQVTIPANLEAIRPNATTQFQLSIQPNFHHADLQYLNGEHALEELFKVLNQFHKDNLDMEMELLDNASWYEQARGNDKRTIEKYSQFVEDLYNQVDKALPNEAYLCLGFGKSFFYNSIGMLVRDWQNKDSENQRKTPFTKYCQLFFLGRDGQKNFPLTRTTTFDGMPLGWVKLSY